MRLRPLPTPAGKPRLGEGWRESAFGPHLYPDTGPGKEVEGSLEKAGACWLPLSPESGVIHPRWVQ